MCISFSLWRQSCKSPRQGATIPATTRRAFLEPAAHCIDCVVLFRRTGVRPVSPWRTEVRRPNGRKRGLQWTKPFLEPCYLCRWRENPSENARSLPRGRSEALFVPATGAFYGANNYSFQTPSRQVQSETGKFCCRLFSFSRLYLMCFSPWMSSLVRAVWL